MHRAKRDVRGGAGSFRVIASSFGGKSDNPRNLYENTFENIFRKTFRIFSNLRTPLQSTLRRSFQNIVAPFVRRVPQAKNPHERRLRRPQTQHGRCLFPFSLHPTTTHTRTLTVVHTKLARTTCHLKRNIARVRG